MDLIEAIRSRRSVRSFKPDPVPKEVLEKIVDTCRWAPSRFNMQSCELAIVGSKTMEELRARLMECDVNKVATKPDVALLELPEPYRTRQLENRDRIDRHQFPPGTPDLDKKRAEYWAKGTRVHDAPNAIIIYTERALCPPAILDAGIMAQTIALTALGFGVSSCIIGRTVHWPHVLRELLGIPENKLIAIALALGYIDAAALINSMPRVRMPLDKTFHWYL